MNLRTKPWSSINGLRCKRRQLLTDAKQVRQLMKHKAFSLANPNRARSLVFAFCNANPSQFHAKDGSAYELWSEAVIALNKLNPQVAARLARSLIAGLRIRPRNKL